jgi:hypothetical protein
MEKIRAVCLHTPFDRRADCDLSSPSRGGMSVRRRWLIAAILGAVMVALFGHAAILRHLAGFLVVDEIDRPYQYVALLDWEGVPDGDRSCDIAVELARAHSCPVLLVESRHTRLVEIGVLPSFAAICRRELATRGVGPSSVSTTRTDGDDDWATARCLRAWLAAAPDETIVVLCGRFRSAHVRHLFDTVLDPHSAARVAVRGLPDRRYDETNWWTSRTGLKGFGVEWLRLLHGWWSGGDHAAPQRLDADDYERDCCQSWRKEPS